MSSRPLGTRHRDRAEHRRDHDHDEAPVDRRHEPGEVDEGSERGSEADRHAGQDEGSDDERERDNTATEPRLRRRLRRDLHPLQQRSHPG